MPDIELSLEAQRSIDDFARAERDLAPSQLKIPEIIPGCVVVSVDPHGVGLGVFPRLIQVRINEFLQLVLWTGFPTLAVGSVCTIVRRGTGNTYQVSGVSGATGVLTDADVYRYHWVYDISLNTLIAYDTIVGATGYPALASGDYILMKPGTFDESVPQVDGVIITEQVPGTTIIHSTSADVAVTCVDGGYLQCKEIRVTRGAGNDAYAVDISGLGGGDECEIRAEWIVATHTGATGAEEANAIHGGGSGTLRVYADHIETNFTGNGGGAANHAIYFDDDTIYVWSDIKAVFSGASIFWTFGVYGESAGTGTCYIRGHIEAEGDAYNAAAYTDGATLRIWGDCTGVSTVAGSFSAGIEVDTGVATVFGNCSGTSKDDAYGVLAIAGLLDTTTVEIYGRCYAETTDAGAGEAIGAHADGAGSPTLRVHGDAIGVDIGGVSYGCHCDAGTLTHTCGRASGVDFDEYRTGGTLQVFMVEFDSYSGAITNYYPMVDDAWIGLAGGAGGRLVFDDQAVDIARFEESIVKIQMATGDPLLTWNTQAADKWTMGVDDSDSDTLKIDSGSTLGTTGYMMLDSNVIVFGHSDRTNVIANIEFMRQAQDGGALVVAWGGSIAAGHTQTVRQVLRHEDAAEEPTMLWSGVVSNSTAYVAFGGGSNSYNACEYIDFYTAATHKTLNGTRRVRFTNNGYVGINNTTGLGGMLGIDINSSAILGIVVQGAVGQAQNYIQCQDSGANIGFQIEPDFDIVIGSGAAGKDYTVTVDGETSDGVITWLEDEAIWQFSDFLHLDSADYRRYYHLDASSFDPGASGATWTDPDGNTVGGWEVTATSQDLQSTVDVHNDWDAVSDLTVEVRFEIAVAGSAPGDVVVLDLDVYLKGVGETVTKSQSLSDTVTVDASAQWTMFEASFTIDYDAVGASVDVGDVIKLVLTLDTANSDVDDVIINKGEFYYNTTHVGIESGDV